MKRVTRNLIILIGLGASLSAQEAPTGVDAEKFGPAGRSAYLRWQKATEEADRTYLRELQQCLDQATRDGKLDEATAIRKEVNRLTARLLGEAGRPLAEFLVGTSWVNSDNGVTVTLQADGKGIRTARGNESRISYEIVSDNQFNLLWPTAPASQCTLAPDRRSYVSGDVTWVLKP